MIKRNISRGTIRTPKIQKGNPCNCVMPKHGCNKWGGRWLNILFPKSYSRNELIFYIKMDIDGACKRVNLDSEHILPSAFNSLFRQSQLLVRLFKDRRQFVTERYQWTLAINFIVVFSSSFAVFIASSRRFTTVRNSCRWWIWWRLLQCC